LQVVFTPGQDKCFLCGQMGHMAAECEGKAKRKMGDEKGDAIVAKLSFQVRVWDRFWTSQWNCVCDSGFNSHLYVFLL